MLKWMVFVVVWGTVAVGCISLGTDTGNLGQPCNIDDDCGGELVCIDNVCSEMLLPGTGDLDLDFGQGDADPELSSDGDADDPEAEPDAESDGDENGAEADADDTDPDVDGDDDADLDEDVDIDADADSSDVVEDSDEFDAEETEHVEDMEVEDEEGDSAGVPIIQIDPYGTQAAPIYFEDILVSECSEALTLEITNIGDGVLEIDSLETVFISIAGGYLIDNQEPEPFVGLRPISLFPDDIASFDVSYCPQHLTVLQNMMLRISSNDPQTPLLDVYFKGTGVECEWGTVDLDPDVPGCETTCYPDPVYEICDNKDNDCDGVTDNGFDIGNACEGTGECGAGTLECQTDLLADCSTNPGGSEDESRTEVCDNKDNDCDGYTDETFDVGEACTGLFGVCAQVVGVYECLNETSLVCSVDYQGSGFVGSVESCNTLDDDCDGTIDNGTYNLWQAGLVPGETPDTCTNCIDEPCLSDGVCGEQVGFWECLSAAAHPEIAEPESWLQCSTDLGGSEELATEEVCDNLDNDCDGLTDEGFFELNSEGEPIHAPCDGIGWCEWGNLICRPDKTGSDCSTNPGMPDYDYRVELCDNQDNDCDGLTDEEWPELGDDCVIGTPNCCGIVECSQDGSGTVCGIVPDPFTPELCDNQDNNCNGETDENFDIGYMCIGIGECGIGVIECVSTTSATCSTNPGASEDESQPEVCDNRDNDCDSQIDEDFSVGDLCEGIGECGWGVLECATPTTSRCSTDLGGSQYAGRSELCDSLDNNCDGETDENWPQLGQSCENPYSGCGGSGVWRCTPDETGIYCDWTPDPDADEICDNLDNDCDGVTDEDFGVGLPCDGVGECGIGVRECASEMTARCSTEAGGSQDQSETEIPDGLDNDCDGQIDEAI